MNSGAGAGQSATTPAKLGARDRGQLVVLAFQAGLVRAG
jgi:hypothetical protein